MAYVVTNYEKSKEAAYCGKIDFLSKDGTVGETIYYEDEQEFKQEIEDSAYCGRPIDYKILR